MTDKHVKRHHIEKIMCPHHSREASYQAFKLREATALHSHIGIYSIKSAPAILAFG